MLSELIGEYVGKSDDYTNSVVSSGTELLIDFYLNESQSEDKACNAGFIGHAELVRGQNTTFAEKSIMSLSRDSIVIKLNLIHFFVFIFTGIILLISVFLGKTVKKFNIETFQTIIYNFRRSIHLPIPQIPASQEQRRARVPDEHTNQRLYGFHHTNRQWPP